MPFGYSLILVLIGQQIITFGSTPETLRMQVAYDLAQARRDESKIKVRRQHVPQELQHPH
jgi:hypothetical protein